MAYDEALLGKGGYHTSAFSYINISLMLLLHQENQSKNQSAFLFFLNNITKGTENYSRSKGLKT